MGFIIIYITHANLQEAKKITSVLLDKKLIACANFFPIESSYWWKGEITSSEEFVSIVKTRKENWRAVKEEVEKLHPYDVPCIMKFEVEANRAYEDWIDKETDGVGNR